MSEWVKTSPDSLPPLDMPVWAYFEENKRIYILVRVIDNEEWFWTNTYFNIHFNEKWIPDSEELDDDYKPSHWMVLPEPPKI